MRLTGHVQVSCSYTGICLADLTASGGFVTQATVQTGPTITLVTTAALSSVVSVRQASRQPAEIWAFHVWRPCRVGARGLMQAASHLAFTSTDAPCELGAVASDASGSSLTSSILACPAASCLATGCQGECCPAWCAPDILQDERAAA